MKIRVLTGGSSTESNFRRVSRSQSTDTASGRARSVGSHLCALLGRGYAHRRRRNTELAALPDARHCHYSSKVSAPLTRSNH